MPADPQPTIVPRPPPARPAPPSGAAPSGSTGGVRLPRLGDRPPPAERSSRRPRPSLVAPALPPLDPLSVVAHSEVANTERTIMMDLAELRELIRPAAALRSGPSLAVGVPELAAALPGGGYRPGSLVE